MINNSNWIFHNGRRERMGWKRGRKKNEVDRGRLLYEAIYKDTILNSIERQKQVWAHYVLILFGSIVLLIGITYALFAMDLDSGDVAGIFVLYLVMIPILYASIWAIINISFSKDQIYENGISSFVHTIFDYYKGEIFTPFKEITRFCWGYGVSRADRNKQFRFVVIYRKNKQRHATILTDDKVLNDFFEVLIRTLNEKCPNVPWYQVEYGSIPWPR
jgi:hypothetical protein